MTMPEPTTAEMLSQFDSVRKRAAKTYEESEESARMLDAILALLTAEEARLTAPRVEDAELLRWLDDEIWALDLRANQMRLYKSEQEKLDNLRALRSRLTAPPSPSAPSAEETRLKGEEARLAEGTLTAPREAPRVEDAELLSGEADDLLAILAAEEARLKGEEEREARARLGEQSEATMTAPPTPSLEFMAAVDGLGKAAMISATLIETDLMGDSDTDEDDSDEFKAVRGVHLAISAVESARAKFTPPEVEDPEPVSWQCEKCGKNFLRETFSHSVAVPDAHGDPVEEECGPISPVYAPAPVATPTTAGPTTGSPSVSMEQIRGAMLCRIVNADDLAEWLRRIGVTVLPDAGKGE
jgi:hypothetical protein